MSSTSDSGDLQRAVASAYVREMLELNPVLHSPQILRRRREIWDQGSRGDSENGHRGATAKELGSGPTTRTAASDSPPPSSEATYSETTYSEATYSDARQERRLRKRAWECLEQLQTEFFSLPVGKLQKHLKFISQERFPEFAERAARLSVLLPHRDTLLSVADKTGDRAFSDALLQSLICPAAKAGLLQEQYIEQIIQQRRVKPACRAIRTLIDRHPEIYQLERDWFDVLLEPKNHVQWRRHYSLTQSVASPLDVGGARILIGGLLLVAIVIVPVIISQNTAPNTRQTPNFRLGTNSQLGTQKTVTGQRARDRAAMLRDLLQSTTRFRNSNAPSTPENFPLPSSSEAPSESYSTAVLPPGSPLVLPPMKDWSLSGNSPTTDGTAESEPPTSTQIQSQTTARPPTLPRLPADWPFADWPMADVDPLSDDFPFLPNNRARDAEWRPSFNGERDRRQDYPLDSYESPLLFEPSDRFDRFAVPPPGS